MNRPVVASERRRGGDGDRPLKLGGYLNTAQIGAPSENTTLFPPSSVQKDSEEWRQEVLKMNLSVNENVPVNVNIPIENATLFRPSSVQNGEDTEEWRHNIQVNPSEKVVNIKKVNVPSETTTYSDQNEKDGQEQQEQQHKTPKVNPSEKIMENVTRKVNIPLKTTTTSSQNKKDMEEQQEQQHNIPKMLKSAPLTPYKHNAGVNITASHPGEQSGDMGERSGGDSPGVSFGATTERGTTRGTRRGAMRGSDVVWGSEDGVVHLEMRPRHRPTPRPVTRIRKPLRGEVTQPPSPPPLPPPPPPHQTADSPSTHTPELSTLVSGVWTTSTPEAEADTPVEMLAGVAGLTSAENIDTLDQVGTNTPEEMETSTGDLIETAVETLTGMAGLTGAENVNTEDQVGKNTPEEVETSTGGNDVTFLPDEWLSSTLQEDWLTFTEIDTQDHSTSPPATHLPLPPALTSSLPPSLTPTFPPSLPPTPSPQDAIEDSFRITTRGLDFLLEASPTGQTPDTTELPKDDLFTLDLTITTTREGLKVEARDVTLDPSQIAKATSYEGSSYPTATRSATVTTTWVDEQKASSGMDSTETPDLNPYDTAVELVDSDTEATEIHDVDVTTVYPSTIEGNTETTPILFQASSEEEVTESPAHTRYKTQIANTKEGRAQNLTRNETQNTARSLSFPVAANVTEMNESVTKGSENQDVVYEIPVVTRNAGPQLSASVVVALSVCCAVVLVLAALSVALWVCRRHKNRSKIYLSREAAKPRAFFTRPMNPAVLPEDSDREDAVYMLEFQRPRPPILLGDDHKGIYFIKREDGEEECRAGMGVENEAFSDVPLGEADEVRTRLDPPKYEQRSKQDSDADSGIRVWSSTGSLHAAASPLPAHCRVPPPPYSPSISKESVCLAVHSLPSLPRNSQLFDV
ncbi:hypothetical protein E2C01_027218 [Portunus trituberculatus]|uniref:Uncharacterized protein n=1 Tax=Portunus trituberculatus TaxID=210409 RepID=A0A5B7EHL4_PORTR|nr:hypothetical protein [Portunus trituberculatus]